MDLNMLKRIGCGKVYCLLVISPEDIDTTYILEHDNLYLFVCLVFVYLFIFECCTLSNDKVKVVVITYIVYW